jgi:hypothetical protein
MLQYPPPSQRLWTSSHQLPGVADATPKRAGVRLAAVFAAGLAGLAALCASGGCGAGSRHAEPPAAHFVRIAAPAEVPRPPFAFGAEDAAFLDDVQRGAFRYLWEVCDPSTGMVYDRTSKPVVSVAGVGFQLAALPIGVERGWITREQGRERASRILTALLANPDNRHAGLFQHFIDPTTAGLHTTDLEHVVSTIDTALLFAGVMVASEYFQADVRTLADRMLSDANWREFLREDSPKRHERGFITLGYRLNDKADPSKGGTMLPFYWIDSGCEHRLTTFLAVGTPTAEFRVPPSTYWRLRRQLGDYPGAGTQVFFPYSGAMFVAAFSHCFIDYAGMPPDRPDRAGVQHRASVDWWENSRRQVKLHQIKAENAAGTIPTLGPDAWGLTACDAPSGYSVPGVYPNPIPMPGAVPEFDFSTFIAKDNLGDGTIAPYGPGMALMFDPARALRALRSMRGLTDADGAPLVWRDPAAPIGQGGGFGFQDSFNLKGPGGTPWVAHDCVAIDQGPMILAIENSRTGLIWELFHKHPAAMTAMRELGLNRVAGRTPKPAEK